MACIKVIEQINSNWTIKAMHLGNAIEIYHEVKDSSQLHITEIIKGDLDALFADIEHLRYLAWLARNANPDRGSSSAWDLVFNRIKIRCFYPPKWTPCKTTRSGLGLEIRRGRSRELG